MRAPLPRRLSVTIPIGILLLVPGVPGTIATAEPTFPKAERLWNRSFVSTQVTEDREPKRLVPGTRIGVSFVRERRHDVIRWSLACNFYGAELTITRKRFLLEEHAGTDMGCSRDRMRQDRWISNFFEANPEWKLRRHHRVLTLTSGETVIRFRGEN